MPNLDITVLLGAPGSGKGTQAKQLADTGLFQHFSTGDMLRAAMREGSEVGLKAKSFVDKGELVPDTIMIEMIVATLKALPEGSKILLDGFPRTIPQAEALDKAIKVDRAIFFDMPQQVLVARLTGRRVCKKCGASFHTEFVPPKRMGVCDRCGGELYQRTDDQADVVQRRLEVFKGQNDQLLAHYRNKNRLRELNADSSIDDIQQKLMTFLNGSR